MRKSLPFAALLVLLLPAAWPAGTEPARDIDWAVLVPPVTQAPVNMKSRLKVEEMSHRSDPAQGYADITPQTAGPLDDLESDLVSEWTQLPVPEAVYFGRYAGKRLFPAGFSLADRPSAVGAELIGEAVNLHFGKTVRDCALHDCRGALHHVFIGNAAWFAELLDKPLLLGLFCIARPGMLRRLLLGRHRELFFCLFGA